eukprot:gene10036-11103_t
MKKRSAVFDEEASDEEEQQEVEQSKKKKAAVKEAVEEEEEEEVKPAAKKAKGSGGGEAVFELGGKRKASVSTFKGKVYINIREFYEDKLTGEEKPGSKGIALTIEQWKVLLSQAEEINAAVAGRSK